MRKPTPNIMDELLPARSETAELRSSLKWDYSQLGDAASAVIEHTIEIKRNERRANAAIVEAGRHLIAVKKSLSHGQWGDWLATEFAMTDRTARTLMSIAERFDGKTEIISDLTPTVLGLLASPSVPEAAVEQVVAATSNGKVTVADAKAIIDQHRTKKAPIRYESGLPALNVPSPMAGKIPIEDCELEDITSPRKSEDAPKKSEEAPRASQDDLASALAEWAGAMAPIDLREGAATRTGAWWGAVATLEMRNIENYDVDDLAAALQRLAAAREVGNVNRRLQLRHWLHRLEWLLRDVPEWAQLTGRYTATGELERGLRRMIELTASELAALENRPHEVAL